jgi:hypothetical protein
MTSLLSKASFTTFLVLVLTVTGLSEPLQGNSWTLDETPVKRTRPLDLQTLIDIPEPLRKLFPILDNLEREVTYDLRSGDAGALLNVVKEISVAEQFSGIGNGATGSDKLLEEATEIAWQQRDPEALRQSLALWSSPVRAGRSRDKILETSERLEQVEDERSQMLTKKRCRIVLHNKTDREVEVFVNRKPVGTLAAGSRHEVGELLAGRQYLGANDSTLQWGPRKVYVGPGEVFNWRLFD